MNKTVQQFIIIILIFNIIVLFCVSDQLLGTLWAPFWDIFLQYAAEVPRPTRIIKEIIFDI